MQELRFDIQDWFNDFVAAMRVPQPSADPREWPPIARLALEALSDASAEQLLNPITASHLRRYGQDRYGHSEADFKGPWFWVRSEWSKVDISYGLAKKAFDGGKMGRGWDSAWCNGDTGDIGQIEAKVCYSHLHIPGPIQHLAKQLEARRNSDLKKDRLHQRYLGIVWLAHHGERTPRQEQTSREHATGALNTACLNQLVEFQTLAKDAPLGHLWPSLGEVKPYVANLDVALVELK